MNLLVADSDSYGNAGGTEPLWRQIVRRPLVVLVLGLLATTVCMLALLGPIYRGYLPPGQILAWWLVEGPGMLLPDQLRSWLREHPFPVLLALWGVVLAIVPWYIADLRHRAARDLKPTESLSDSTSSSGFSISTRVTRERRETSVEFTEHGRIERSDATAYGSDRYRVEDLRSMAHAAGIPWKHTYETEGGARAFLEILRAVHAGTAPAPTAAAEPTAERSAAVAEPSAAVAEPTATAGSVGGPTRSTPSASFTPSTTPISSWSSDATSSSGSFYTPTSLYDAERAERSVMGTDSEDVEGTEESR